ncbi:hypothetical protein PTTG_28480 [Puccinia triticina 1-1 BBBD Race 1]|uniref:Uncharacterized protein n=1 Tax=Puccinia triticina (isolate 1-1 / race 1 (BBBD)) TaxID=630390 RepID=A0A180GBP9_PUCT1|nr:hypothetical protein PTTG_28480 [Puccinia triticina 1-1 BBBD Race 1]
MDNPPHLSASHRAANLEEAKIQLEESKIVGQAIHAATAKILENLILAPDGSKFEVWSCELAEKGGIHLNNREFFTQRNAKLVLKKTGKAIFLSLVHDFLKSDVHRAETCFNMYKLMFKKFKSISRAAQLDVFYRFNDFKNSGDVMSAKVASSLKDLATKWKNLKIELTTEIFMGFILQSSLGRDTPLGREFDRRVELKD